MVRVNTSYYVGTAVWKIHLMLLCSVSWKCFQSHMFVPKILTMLNTLVNDAKTSRLSSPVDTINYLQQD